MYRTTMKALLVCLSIAFSSNAQEGHGARISKSGSQWEKGGFFEGYTPQQEILQERTQTTKHFKNADGTITAQIGGTMHYRDSKGSWQDINPAITSLTATNGYSYGNVTNEIKSYFPNAAGLKPVEMFFNGKQSLKWWNSPKMDVTLNGSILSFKNINKGNGVTDNNSIRYANAYPGITEEFEVIPAGLENNTIIHAMTAELTSLPAQSLLEFSQVISLEKGWSVVANGQKQSGSFDAKNFSIQIPGFEAGLSFSKIVIFDNSLTKSEAMYLAYAPREKLTSAQKEQFQDHVLVVNYHAEFTTEGLKITTKLPVQWLKNTSRSFPVVIDPTVTVGLIDEGSFKGPISHWYGFQRHADLYLQSEIGAYGSITAIEYYKTGESAARTKPAKIYMRSATVSTLTSSAAWNSPTYTGGLSPLFNGNTTQDDVPGWKMITLTTPFNYTSGNLLVMVYDEYGGSGSAQYFAEPTVAGRQAFKRQDNTDPGDASTMELENVLQSIRITYVADTNTCVVPSAASALVTSATTATLNWTSTVANSEVAIQIAGTGTPAAANGTGTDVIGATTYSATGLLPSTNYEFYVRSECTAGTAFSAWAGPYNFTTILAPNCATNPTPANGATDVATGNVLFSWTAATTGDAADSYDLYYGLTPGNATLPLGNFTTTSAQITLTGYNTTFYWKVVPVNAGGSNSTCGEWSFTTMSPPPAPANDECATSTLLLAGGEFATNDITGTNESATNSTGSPVPVCAHFTGGDVWYSVAVPASGSLTVETNSNPGSLIQDTGMALYSGTCGTLTLIECNDDSSEDGNFSLITLTGRTAGEIIHVRVWEYDNNAIGTFRVSAYDASLGNAGFDKNAFSFYPNPVKDVLNLSYSQTMNDIVVFNLLGQQVFAKTINATDAEVNLSQLASGAYLVRVSAENEVKTIKIIKE